MCVGMLLVLHCTVLVGVKVCVGMLLVLHCTVLVERENVRWDVIGVALHCVNGE